MKNFVTVILMTFLSATIAFSDPIHGVWQTSKDDNGAYGHIRVTNCGETICGELIKSFDSKGQSIESKNIGKKIIWDMKVRKNGKYGGGKIWSPDRDKIYNSKLVLSGDNLKVSGCVLLVCRDGGTWTRVK